MGRLWKFRKDEVDEWVKTGGADDSRIDDSGKLGCRDARGEGRLRKDDSFKRFNT